jgi:hypothetical protein
LDQGLAIAAKLETKVVGCDEKNVQAVFVAGSARSAEWRQYRGRSKTSSPKEIPAGSISIHCSTPF